MKARFATKCAVCGEMIKVGREIARDPQDRWVHKYCTEEADEFP